jgi:hypothetical protein
VRRRHKRRTECLQKREASRVDSCTARTLCTLRRPSRACTRPVTGCDGPCKHEHTGASGRQRSAAAEATDWAHLVWRRDVDLFSLGSLRAVRRVRRHARAAGRALKRHTRGRRTCTSARPATSRPVAANAALPEPRRFAGGTGDTAASFFERSARKRRSVTMRCIRPSLCISHSHLTPPREGLPAAPRL